MATLYTRTWIEVVEAGHSKYVWSDRVPAGMVLLVYNCFAHASEREANDIAQIGVRNGGQDTVVRCRANNVAGEGTSALNHFPVGETDQIYAYFPDSDNTDTIELHVIGVLMPRDEFRQM